MATRFALVRDDEGDWIGLYENGLLVYENHSISERKLLELVGIPCRQIGDVNLEEFDNHLPPRLDQLEGKGKDW